MRRAVLFLVAALASGCGLSTAVRPVPKDSLQLEGSLGGPLVKVGPVLPVPLSAVGARYGVADRLDVSAHAHLTTLAFGVAGLDVGSSWLALEQEGFRPAVAVAGRLYGFTGLLAGREASPRAYLELSPAVSTLLGEHFLTYVSGTAMAQLAGGPVLFSAAAGEELQLGRWGLQLEARWYQPGVASRNMAADWQGPAGLGALGVVLGARYRFGGEGK
jgi:hypothetical protein